MPICFSNPFIGRTFINLHTLFIEFNLKSILSSNSKDFGLRFSNKSL